MDRQVGSHQRWKVPYTLPDGTPAEAATSVAFHARDIPAGTLRAIERDLEPAFGRKWLT
ncbi:MAG: type II toxin-antitoxin system HicA family toxin [Dehalococcoidia bacterium]